MGGIIILTDFVLDKWVSLFTLTERENAKSHRNPFKSKRDARNWAELPGIVIYSRSIS